MRRGSVCPSVCPEGPWRAEGARQVKPKQERALSPPPGKKPSASGPPHPVAAPRLVGVREAAAILNISVAAVRRLVVDGRLPVVRLNRRLLIDVRDLDHLIDRAKARSHWTVE